MKKLNLIAFAILGSLMLVFSCKISTEKSKVKLDDVTQNTIDQFNELKGTDFGTAFYGILNVGIPDISSKSVSVNQENIDKVKNIGIALRNSLITKYPKIFNQKFGSEQFSLSTYAGTYTFKSSDSTWTKVASPSDQIIILFPSKNSTSNDCKLVWSKYSEIKCTDTNYYPTVIYAELFKDNNSIGLIDLNMTYNVTTSIPTKADVILRLEPMKFIVNYTYENKILKIQTAMKKGSRTLDDLDAEIVFDDNTFSKLLSGSGVFKTYKLEGSVNFSVLMKVKFDFDATSDINSCSNFNDKVHINLYASSDRYIGKIICTDDECGATIMFDDGTTQCTSVYFDKIQKALDNSLPTK